MNNKRVLALGLSLAFFLGGLAQANTDGGAVGQAPKSGQTAAGSNYSVKAPSSEDNKSANKNSDSAKVGDSKEKASPASSYVSRFNDTEEKVDLSSQTTENSEPKSLLEMQIIDGSGLYAKWSVLLPEATNLTSTALSIHILWRVALIKLCVKIPKSEWPMKR